MTTALYVLIVVLLGYNAYMRDRLQDLKRDFNAYRKSTSEAIQLLADKFDVDTELSEARYSGFHTSMDTLDTKLHGLAKAAGYELVNGLWQKAVVKKATNVAPKATTTKPARGGKK